MDGRPAKPSRKRLIAYRRVRTRAGLGVGWQVLDGLVQTFHKKDKKRSSPVNTVIPLRPRKLGDAVVSPGNDAPNPPTVREVVARSVRRYLDDMGHLTEGELHRVMLAEVEAPMIAEVLRHCRGNQSRAASILGISRGTLRKKLTEYRLG
jgi:Fis family transcriptional regulator